MASLWHLFVYLVLALSPTGDRIESVDVAAFSETEDGVYREWYGETTCHASGEWTIKIASRRDSSVTLVHELLHAYDCEDDGLLNGSPGYPSPEGHADPAHWYVHHALAAGSAR